MSKEFKRDLDRIKILLKQITPGPWFYDVGNWNVETQGDEMKHHITGEEIPYRAEVVSIGNDHDYMNIAHPEDAEFIALCRNILPELLKIVEKSNGSR